MKVLDGKELALTLDKALAVRVQELQAKGIFPKLSVILVGDHPPSRLYVRKKKEACQKLGILVDVFDIPLMSWKLSLSRTIKDLNTNPTVHGILIQMPLPEDALSFLEMVNPYKDVDGLHPDNLAKLFLGKPRLIPCTPLACVSLLHETTDSFEGKQVTIIGRSILVGRPLFLLLLHHGATVTLTHSKTKNLANVCARSDILISATGIAGLVNQDFVKPGAIVIDVGISTHGSGRLTGDVDFESVSRVTGFLTPVPGGVGPMTVHHVTSNVIKACEESEKNQNC